jgi:hypothetical protein
MTILKINRNRTGIEEVKAMEKEGEVERDL